MRRRTVKLELHGAFSTSGCVSTLSALGVPREEAQPCCIRLSSSHRASVCPAGIVDGAENSRRNTQRYETQDSLQHPFVREPVLVPALEIRVSDTLYIVI